MEPKARRGGSLKASDVASSPLSSQRNQDREMKESS